MSLQVFLILLILFPGLLLSQTVPKIAIIGGGIGGTSCAYFLKQLFQNKADISLFEKDSVGGRLAVLNIDGNKYEAGATILDHRNQYMAEFSKLLGLGMRQPQSSKLGIYDGEKFVFEGGDWHFLTLANVLWHYGLSVSHLNKDVSSMLNDFNRIYNLQEKGYAYTAVDRLLNSMNSGFVNMTQISLSEILLEKGYSHKFLDEFVQSIIMGSFGQTNDISGFVGYVALGFAEGNIWSVEGGNKLVPEGLLKISGANFIRASVDEVELLPDQKFLLKYKESSSNEHFKTDNFNIVILSAPFIKGSSNIKFVNFSENFQQYERSFHQSVSTFIKGTLRPAAFNNKVSLPDEILANNDKLLFNSIRKCTPIDNDGKDDKKDIYNVISQKPLSKESVEKLFESVSALKDKVWLSNPHYKPPEEFIPFILHPRLYYTNAIELAASGMEMSAIAAKNIALLIYNSWKNIPNKIDVPTPILKEEL